MVTLSPVFVLNLRRRSVNRLLIWVLPAFSVFQGRSFPVHVTHQIPHVSYHVLYVRLVVDGRSILMVPTGVRLSVLMSPTNVRLSIPIRVSIRHHFNRCSGPHVHPLGCICGSPTAARRPYLLGHAA